MNPKVKLIAKTSDIKQTLWKIWQLSRTQEPYADLDVDAQHADDFFVKVLNENIPLTDMIEFIFLIENVPISLREQMVRHRMGIKFGDRLGMDLIPEIMDSTWWAQSMRVLDMSEFDYFVPSSIQNSDKVLLKDGRTIRPKQTYDHAMEVIKKAYVDLLQAGIFMEDARQLMPLGATHRLVWKMSLSALAHVCSKRSCWIAQLGMWKWVIQGMITEVSDQVSPLLHLLATPPCIRNEKFQGCKFCEHNMKRVTGEGEEMPPCTLFLYYHKDELLDESVKQTLCSWNMTSKGWESGEANNVKMQEMKKEYEIFWGRNVYTGALL